MFVITAISVPMAVYVLVPGLCRLFDPWVFREQADPLDAPTASVLSPKFMK